MFLLRCFIPESNVDKYYTIIAKFTDIVHYERDMFCFIVFFYLICDE